ncbi:MAG: beta-propeller fold lactonase family protein [Phycisphaerales bacterium]|nr:beta-propeller fold lactonase family protein [Phycisphaerales bacterium]
MNLSCIRATICVACWLFAPLAPGQPAEPAAFVGNNGNAEGSVTSFVFGPGGEPVFVQKTPAANNAYGLSLSPSGKWLAVTHTTASTTVEAVEVFGVHADATLTLEGSFTTPDSPLDCAWVTDSVLVVTRTRINQPNELISYRFSPASGPVPASLVEVGREGTGTFTAYVTVHPGRQVVFTGDSDLNTFRAFRVDGGGGLAFLMDNFTGAFPIGPGITHDGRHLYAGGGTSAGGHTIHAYAINAGTGELTPVPGAPFSSVSPGSSPSPKLAVASSDDAYVFVGHGSSSEVRSLARDPLTGALTDTGNAFDVGIQGDLGGVAVLGNLLLVTDSYSGTGLYSFTIHGDGSFTMNGGLVSTQGVTPREVVAWEPPAGCYADCNGDGVLNLSDFGCFTTKFALGDLYADCNADGVRNLADFGCFQTKFALGCP